MQTRVFLRKVTSDPEYDHFFKKDAYTYVVPKGTFPTDDVDNFLFTSDEWSKFAHFVPDFESINENEVLAH